MRTRAEMSAAGPSLRSRKAASASPGVELCEDDAAATQAGVAFEVDGSHVVLVHQEDDFAARAGESGPVTGEDSFVQCFVVAANVVGSDELTGREDRMNLSIEGVKGGRVKGSVSVRWSGLGLPGLSCLGLNEDEDGDVVGMGAGPGFDLLQAASERLATAAVVDVLDVHDLEAWLEHHAIGIKLGVGGESGSGYVFGPKGCA